MRCENPKKTHNHQHTTTTHMCVTRNHKLDASNNHTYTQAHFSCSNKWIQRWIHILPLQIIRNDNEYIKYMNSLTQLKSHVLPFCKIHTHANSGRFHHINLFVRNEWIFFSSVFRIRKKWVNNGMKLMQEYFLLSNGKTDRSRCECEKKRTHTESESKIWNDNKNAPRVFVMRTYLLLSFCCCRCCILYQIFKYWNWKTMKTWSKTVIHSVHGVVVCIVWKWATFYFSVSCMNNYDNIFLLNFFRSQNLSVYLPSRFDVDLFAFTLAT